jgi:hypothetical protein
MNLFKKAAVFTDIHFGLKSNSTQHIVMDTTELKQTFNGSHEWSNNHDHRP